MSAKSKIRGYNHEISVRDKHIDNAVLCERVPLSGAIGGKYTGDLVIPTVERPLFVLECKARRNGAGFKLLEDWIEGKDILFLRRNHQEDLVVMPFSIYIKLMKAYYDKATSDEQRSTNS